MRSHPAAVEADSEGDADGVHALNKDLPVSGCDVCSKAIRDVMAMRCIQLCLAC